MLLLLLLERRRRGTLLQQSPFPRGHDDCVMMLGPSHSPGGRDKARDCLPPARRGISSVGRMPIPEPLRRRRRGGRGRRVVAMVRVVVVNAGAAAGGVGMMRGATATANDVVVGGIVVER